MHLMRKCKIISVKRSDALPCMKIRENDLFQEQIAIYFKSDNFVVVKSNFNILSLTDQTVGNK